MEIQVAHLALQTEESRRRLPERVTLVEEGISLLETLAAQLGTLGRLEAPESAIRTLCFWCTARVVSATSLILGGSWSEGMEILRSAVEGLAEQHLFTMDEAALNAWFDGTSLGSGRLLRSVDEEGFGRFWASLGKHAHPTLEAVGAYSRHEDSVAIFDPYRPVAEGDLCSALDATAALVEREILLLAKVFGGRLSATVEDARTFFERFAEFRTGLRATARDYTAR